MTIEPASESHLPGILAIYNDAVVNTTAVWNDNVVDLENRRKWLAARQATGYPVLVSLDGQGGVAGYASFGDFRPFEGYRFSVEHSIYVRTDQRRNGVARALMADLIDAAVRLGKHTMIGAIDAQNAPSIRLHEKLGFEQTGRMPEVGTKFGRWLDLVWMQRKLS